MTDGTWRTAGLVLGAVGVCVVLVGALALIGVWGYGGSGRNLRAGLSLSGTLGGDASDASGYARADSVRTFVFPDDHGPHPAYRTEWWYITGNVRTPEGRRFGYQLTFFRNAVAPREAGLDSEWSTNQVWMAHFALTDAEAGSFEAYERFDRQALGLAGAAASPFRVWLGDWELAGSEDDPFPLTLRASAGGVEVELVLEPGKDLILQGDAGLSRKGPELGDASYYYSFTRLRTSGRITVGDESLDVQGTSWLDREWSTSVLPEGVVGWDWFALQLDGGRELMVYRLRSNQGPDVAFSYGVWVDEVGAVRKLVDKSDFSIEETASWRSPMDGAVYPAGWQVRVPALDLDLHVAPVLADQELDLSFRYWEGAVDVSGHLGSSWADGVGYVELTGYGRESQTRGGGGG